MILFFRSKRNKTGTKTREKSFEYWKSGKKHYICLGKVAKNTKYTLEERKIHA